MPILHYPTIIHLLSPILPTPLTVTSLSSHPSGSTSDIRRMSVLRVMHRSEPFVTLPRSGIWSWSVHFYSVTPSLWVNQVNKCQVWYVHLHRVHCTSSQDCIFLLWWSRQLKMPEKPLIHFIAWHCSMRQVFVLCPGVALAKRWSAFPADMPMHSSQRIHGSLQDISESLLEEIWWLWAVVCIVPSLLLTVIEADVCWWP